MAYIKASERRGQLVAAARAVLAPDGVAGTTLRAVATEAKVPLGTLHYVFPTKDLLITAVIPGVTDEVSASSARPSPTPASSTPSDAGWRPTGWARRGRPSRP